MSYSPTTYQVKKNNPSRNEDPVVTTSPQRQVYSNEFMYFVANEVLNAYEKRNRKYKNKRQLLDLDSIKLVEQGKKYALEYCCFHHHLAGGGRKQ